MNKDGETNIVSRQRIGGRGKAKLFVSVDKEVNFPQLLWGFNYASNVTVYAFILTL
jgi:hypothetical protein